MRFAAFVSFLCLFFCACLSYRKVSPASISTMSCIRSILTALKRLIFGCFECSCRIIAISAMCHECSEEFSCRFLVVV